MSYRLAIAAFAAGLLATPTFAAGTYSVQSGGQKWGAIPFHMEGGRETVLLIPENTNSITDSIISAAARAYVSANNLPCEIGGNEWLGGWGGWQVTLLCSKP